jgi:hypothetical protein
MSTLNGLYESLSNGGANGLRKTAAAGDPEMNKLAGHYYDIGRGMARAQFADMLKQALDEGVPPEEGDLTPEEVAAAAGGAEGDAMSEEEELAKRKAEMLARLEAEEAAAAEGGMPPAAGGEMPPGPV